VEIVLNRRFLANLFHEQTFRSLNRSGTRAMDERRTLAILAWTVGSVVAVMFVLNAIALSFVGSEPALAGRQVATQHASPNPPPPSVLRISTRGG
jgi:hypothetical protein